MSKHPAEPHLFEVAIKNNGDPFIVRAGSLAEARNFVVDEFIKVDKLSPSRAFRAGREGPDILNAKPEYAVFDEPDDLFTDPSAPPSSDAQGVQHV